MRARRLLWMLWMSAGLFACADKVPGSSGTPEGTNNAVVPDAGGENSATNNAESDASPDPVCVDNDLDGYGESCGAGPDCNDQRNDIRPGRAEVCDGVDNDCDGVVDPDCPCTDGKARECYDGPQGSQRFGLCRGGVQQCVGGVWGECTGQALPGTEVCDGLDNNCDGNTDEGLANACGTCGAVPAEACGDGLDNDCDGLIDESAEGCNCDLRASQPCYGGPPQTLGVGQCRGGLHDCEGQDWGACRGQVLPSAEVCDGVDNDCDGLVDEGLRNACGGCEPEPPAEVCDGYDNDCDGIADEGLTNLCGTCSAEVPREACGDGLDNDCDGNVDEACGCSGEPTCYPGPPATLGVGLCAAGTRACDGEFWEACTGAVTPQEEICDGQDNDCDGNVDEGPGGCSICGPQEEVCDGLDNDCDRFVDEFVTNACGLCGVEPPAEACDGVDNDCDGLIDEGLLNACGQCGNSCFIEEWSIDNGRLGEGSFEGTEVSQNQQDPGVRLGRGSFTLPFIWIANSAENTVSKLNTETGAEVGRYSVGNDPSRTAVDLNGDVWVANRQSNNVHRIRLDGCEGQACVDPPINVGGLPRGLAVDANNNVWVANWNDSNVMRINTQRMQVDAVVSLPGNPYGLAIDGDGFLWTSERGGGWITKIDTTSAQLLNTYTPPFSRDFYGICTDAEKNVWIANFQQNNILKYVPSTNQWFQFRDPNARSTRGIAADSDGFIWVANSGSNNVSKFHARTGQLIGTYPAGSGPIGVAVDNLGNVWAVNQGSNNTTKFSPDGAVLGTYRVGSGPYTYSDMTGFQLRTFTLRQGRWVVNFDCGRPNCTFDTLTWRASVPPGTQLELRARTSLDRVTWSSQEGPYGASPSPMSLPVGRYCEVEVRMSTDNDEISPVLQSVEVGWQRP